MIQIIIKIFSVILLLIMGCLNAQTTWSLNDCIEYATINHPNIKQTALSIANAKEDVLSAKGELLPNLNVGMNHNYSFGSTINPATNSREALNVMNDQFYVSSSVELFNWRNFLNIKLQKFQKESFQYNLEAQKNELKLNIIQQFYAYQNAKAWQEVLASQINGIDEQIKRTEKEVEIGTRPKSDVYDIKANLGIIKESWLKSKNDTQTSKLSLLSLLNIKKDTLDFEINDLNTLKLAEIQDLETYVQANPAIQNLEKQAEIKDKEIAMAKSERLPTLGGQYQFQTFYSKVLNDNSTTASFNDQLSQNKNHFVGFSLGLPIFNRFQIKTKTAKAKIAKENILLEKEKVETDLLNQLKTIHLSYQNSLENLELVTANFHNQKLSFERSVQKFNEGLIDAYTFFIVRNNWLNANFNLIKSKNEALMQEKLLDVFVRD